MSKHLDSSLGFVRVHSLIGIAFVEAIAVVWGGGGRYGQYLEVVAPTRDQQQ